MAAVPDVAHLQKLAPTVSANRFSKRATIVPFVQFNVPDSMTRPRSSSSSSPKERPDALASDGRLTLGVLMNGLLRLSSSSMGYDGSAVRADGRRERVVGVF